jgi:hypothetical protein
VSRVQRLAVVERGCDVPCDVVGRGSPDAGKACQGGHVQVHGCPLDRVERSGYESECNVGVEGKCVSDGLRQQVGCVSGGESVGMWVAPNRSSEGEGGMGTGWDWLSVRWPVDPEERVPIWITLA